MSAASQPGGGGVVVAFSGTAYADLVAMRCASGSALAVARGQRPETPAGCDEHFAALLPQCWAQEPGDRISFERICALSDAAAPRFPAPAAPAAADY